MPLSPQCGASPCSAGSCPSSAAMEPAPGSFSSIPPRSWTVWSLDDRVIGRACHWRSLLRRVSRRMSTASGNPVTYPCRRRMKVVLALDALISQQSRRSARAGATERCLRSRSDGVSSMAHAFDAGPLRGPEDARSSTATAPGEGRSPQRPFVFAPILHYDARARAAPGGFAPAVMARMPIAHEIGCRVNDAGCATTISTNPSPGVLPVHHE